jgi:hypothetical protein
MRLPRTCIGAAAAAAPRREAAPRDALTTANRQLLGVCRAHGALMLALRRGRGCQAAPACASGRSAALPLPRRLALALPDASAAAQGAGTRTGQVH